MVTEVNYGLSNDEFPLGTIFENHPGVTIELERVVPTNHAIIPYFWVRGENIDNIGSAFGSHLGIRTIELVDHVADQYLLRGEWSPDQAGVLRGFAEAEVTLLTGRGTESGWVFVVRSETQEGIASFHQYCQEHEIPITVRSLHELTPPRTSDNRLTDTQMEALLLAFNRGYYDTPRESTLEEMAAELGITHQALASRLRRGTRRLIMNSLVDSD